jgi:hypothetical protein
MPMEGLNLDEINELETDIREIQLSHHHSDYV